MHALRFLLIICCISLSNHKKIPSFVKQCKMKDPDLDECMKNTLLGLQPYLKEGIPEMKIGSMNPFHVSKVALNSGGYKLQFNDMEMYGLDMFNVESFHMDFDKNVMEFTTFYSNLHMQGNYLLSGRLLLFEVEGSGYSVANYTDVRGIIKISGTRRKAKGKEYIKFEDIDIIVEYEDCSIRFDDLFKNNQDLTRRVNEVINENIKDLITEIKPLIEKTVSAILFPMVKAVFDTYSIHELFL